MPAPAITSSLVLPGISAASGAAGAATATLGEALAGFDAVLQQQLAAGGGLPGASGSLLALLALRPGGITPAATAPGEDPAAVLTADANPLATADLPAALPPGLEWLQWLGNLPGTPRGNQPLADTAPADAAAVQTSLPDGVAALPPIALPATGPATAPTTALAPGIDARPAKAAPPAAPLAAVAVPDHRPAVDVASSSVPVLAGPAVPASAAAAGEPPLPAALAGEATADPTLAAAAARLAVLPENSAAPSATGAVGGRIASPLGSGEWNGEIGNHIAWMASHQQSRAELVLTPPQLGRIEVSLSVTGDQATALFVSASPAVREALENALPRLREVLAEAGISLGQAQVGAESRGQSARHENGDNAAGRPEAGYGGEGPAKPLSAPLGVPWLNRGRGMVDIYA